MREPIVVSSNSTMMYRDGTVGLRQIGRELGVRYVVSGTVRRAGCSLRITAELAEAENGAVIWAHSYDTQDPMSFDAQDDIVAMIVHTLGPHIQEAELRRLRTRRPEVMGGYDLLLQARDLVFQLDMEKFEEAGRLIKRAIALDSRYAAAHSLAADWHSLRIGQGWSPDPAADAQALGRFSENAIRLDRSNARALALLGHNKTILHRQYDAAMGLFDKALDAAPNDASGWMWSSPTYAFIGHGAEAVRRAERALRLSPRDPFIFRCYHFLCIAHFTNGAFEEAVRWGRLSLSEQPGYTSNLRSTTAALVALGRIDEARVLAQKICEVEPGFRVGPLLDRHPYQHADRRIHYVEKLVEAGLPE